MLDTIKDFIPPIHKEGYVFILLFALATLILFAVSDKLGIIGLILTVWCVYFFRDPIRVVPDDSNLVISPADGLITSITNVPAPKEVAADMDDEEFTRVSIFLNVFDVHVNRSPVTGKISRIKYHPGKFLNATLDKASEDNERNTMLIEHESGKKFVVVQIAGLIARRIVCDAESDQDIKAGERYGIIRFGSRVDVYMPKSIKPGVIVGQRAIGGETVIADIKGSKAAPKGKKI
jgi:phosphatidylserine decarboxylase